MTRLLIYMLLLISCALSYGMSPDYELLEADSKGGYVFLFIRNNLPRTIYCVFILDNGGIFDIRVRANSDSKQFREPNDNYTFYCK